MLYAGMIPAYATSLGPIQLLSGLGQPLHVTIPLSSDGSNDLGSACIRARLELTDGTFISAPRISLTHSARTDVIDLSTKQSINEPAITLHVEIGCGTAIRRNYQVLLDPVNAAATVRMQKAAAVTSAATQRQATSDLPVKAKAVNGTQRKPDAKKPATANKEADVVPLPTFTKEMSLSSSHPGRKAPNKASQASNDAKWIPEDSITPVLKLSAALADANSADDAKKTEEFRAEQTRFAAIINGEDVTQNAEAKMKAAQAQMLRLQAENEQKKLQAQSEKAAQDEQRKVSFPIAWFAGLGALLLICLAVIVWIVIRLIRARRSPAAHSWKNYHAASDTLIADLSTQTLLDSEFLNTAGESYNTAVFSDTEFDMAPITECDMPDGELEDDPEDALEEDHDISESVMTDPATVTPLAHATENKPVEKPAIPKAPAVVVPESNSPSKAEVNPASPSPVEALAPALPPAQPLKPAIKAAKQEEPSNARTASAPTAKSAPSAPAVPAAPPKKRKEATLTLNVKEIADIMQQAEFWMLLQDPFRAIEILEPYRDVAQPESPAPWIYLLDLYRMVGDKKKYELLLVRIEYVFNAKIPRWDGQFGITPRTLNDFPHVVEKICALWETDEIVPYLESLLIDQRDGTRQGFDLPVYRNIVQLITLAREPDKSKEHEQLRYGKAQAILFSQQPTHPEQVEPSVASKPAAKAPTAIKLDPVRQDPSPETASHVSNELNQPTAATTPVIAPINMDAKNDALLSEPEINMASYQVAEPADKNADDNVEYGNASPMETKLELALAYQEIGEKDGARELLYEVIKDGSAEQSEKAKLILKRMN
ncbi:MAG: FimV/HubP family polar landmark protein [Burkholderiaceae bacterium]